MDARETRKRLKETPKEQFVPINEVMEEWPESLHEGTRIVPLACISWVICLVTMMNVPQLVKFKGKHLPIVLIQA